MACAKKCAVFLSEHDLMFALKDFDIALTRDLMYEVNTQAVLRDLNNVSAALAAFIYLNTHTKFIAHVWYSKALLTQAENIYYKIIL